MQLAHRRSLLCVLPVAAFSAGAVAGGPPIASWSDISVPSGSAWTLADLTAVGPNGETYVATRPQVGGGNGTGLLKYDADGTLLWEIIREDVPNRSEGITDLEITAEGISVFGNSRNAAGDFESLLINYASDGKFLWEARTVGPQFAGFLQPQLAIGPAGERVIATDDGNGKGRLERYDASGNLLSGIPLSFVGFGGVSALEVDDNGDAIVVSVDNSSLYRVQKFDADGTMLWMHEESAFGLALSEAFMAIDDNGDVIVSGSLEVLSKGVFSVVNRVWRHAPDGTVLWTVDSDSTFAIGQDLALGSTGEVYTISNVSGGEPTLMRIDADGVAAWTQTFDGGDFQTSFRHVEVSSFGDVIVGALDSAGLFLGARVLCISPNGDIEWTDRIVEIPDNVFVGGDLQTGADGHVAFVTTTRPQLGDDRALTMHLRFAPCTGDLNGDHAVDFTDVLMLLAAWDSGPGSAADFDQDGTVGFTDLLTLLSAFGSCPVNG